MSVVELPIAVDLKGKTAAVTGAGGVLCSEFSKALAACGANVALIGRRFETLEKVAEEIRAEGGICKSYEANVLNPGDMRAAAKNVEKDFGPCCILINGAGGNSPLAATGHEYYASDRADGADAVNSGKSLFDLDPEDVSAVFDLNFLGTFISTQALARSMGMGGVIINISSMNAFTPLTKIPAYSGAKAAVSNFTQWLAVYFSKTGIRVNAIAPGFFRTAQNENLLFGEDGAPTERTKKILAATPMERLGVPGDLIGTLLYLVSNEASGFVTGAIIPVDGGFSAYSGV